MALMWFYLFAAMKTAVAQKMDRYQRVEKPRAETPIDENEIRITSQGRMRNYITYAMTLLQVSYPSSLILASLFFFFGILFVDFLFSMHHVVLLDSNCSVKT